MTNKLKIYIETYGCQMNEYDSELVASILSQNGTRIVNSEDEADVILINTCAVRETARLAARAPLAIAADCLKNVRRDDDALAL